MPIDTTPTDRIMLAGLMSDQNFWSLLSRNSKYKYWELLKEESQNDELTNHLRETFAESADNLKQELDTWLLGLDVTEK